MESWVLSPSSAKPTTAIGISASAIAAKVSIPAPHPASAIKAFPAPGHPPLMRFEIGCGSSPVGFNAIRQPPFLSSYPPIREAPLV